MATQAVDSNLYVPENKTRTPKKVLDKNDFLNLLVNQLKNQDPLEPQSNEEFMSTMAQFNSLETLVSLDKSSQYSQAMSLVGRQVTVQKPEKDPVTGKVEKAGMVDGKPVVYVDGQEYSLSEVMEVTRDSTKTLATGNDLIMAAMMIGKEVLVRNGSEEITGIVQKVALEDGSLKVSINGVSYEVAGIAEIKDPSPAAAPTAGNGEQPEAGVI